MMRTGFLGLGGQPQPTGFTNVPLSIAGGPALYLDGAVPSLLSIDTGVDAWTDSSGNGLDAVNTTDAEQPTYTPDTGLSFDGSDDRLVTSGGTAHDEIWAGGGYAVWVASLPSDTANAGFCDKNTGGGGWRLKTNSTAGAGSKFQFEKAFDDTDGRWDSDDRIFLKSAYQIYEIIYDSDAVGNDPTFHVNGVSVALTEVATPVGTAELDAARDFTLGSLDAGTTPVKVDVKALLLYATTPTATERAAVRQALGRKFGVATV